MLRSLGDTRRDMGVGRHGRALSPCRVVTANTILIGLCPENTEAAGDTAVASTVSRFAFRSERRFCANTQLTRHEVESIS